MNAMTVAYVIDVSLPTSPCFCHLYNHHSFKLILILAHFYYSTNNYSTNFVHFKRANSYVLTIKILETPQPPKSPTKPFSTKRCPPQCLPRQIFHSIFVIFIMFYYVCITWRTKTRSITSNDTIITRLIILSSVFNFAWTKCRDAR